MASQGIEHLSGVLDRIVEDSTPSVSSKESLEKHTEEQRQEENAIKEGIRAAQTTAVQIEASLKEIEQSLTNLSNNLNSVIQEGPSSSLQQELQDSNRQSLEAISNANQRLETLTADFPEGDDFEPVQTENLENLATGLGTSEEALEARQSLQNALQTTLGNKASINLLAHQLGQQLVTSEDVAQGTFGLSRFTDADLLLDAARRSQLDESLHTEVLVEAEADQQNRRIGRLLNQLS